MATETKLKLKRLRKNEMKTKTKKIFKTRKNEKFSAFLQTIKIREHENLLMLGIYLGAFSFKLFTLQSVAQNKFSLYQ